MNGPDDRFTLAEELAIGWPLPIPDDGFVCCDVTGCLEPAAVMVAAAVLCARHLNEFMVPGGDRYRIPHSRLVLDADGREGRRRAYVERLEQLRSQFGGGARRDPRSEAALQRLIRLAVDDLIRSTGASP